MSEQVLLLLQQNVAQVFGTTLSELLAHEGDNLQIEKIKNLLQTFESRIKSEIDVLTKAMKNGQFSESVKANIHRAIAERVAFRTHDCVEMRTHLEAWKGQGQADLQAVRKWAKPAQNPVNGLAQQGLYQPEFNFDAVDVERAPTAEPSIWDAPTEVVHKSNVNPVYSDPASTPTDPKAETTKITPGTDGASDANRGPGQPPSPTSPDPLDMYTHEPQTMKEQLRARMVEVAHAYRLVTNCFELSIGPDSKSYQKQTDFVNLLEGFNRSMQALDQFKASITPQQYWDLVVDLINEDQQNRSQQTAPASQTRSPAESPEDWAQHRKIVALLEKHVDNIWDCIQAKREKGDTRFFKANKITAHDIRQINFRGAELRELNAIMDKLSPEEWDVAFERACRSSSVLSRFFLGQEWLNGRNLPSMALGFLPQPIEMTQITMSKHALYTQYGVEVLKDEIHFTYQSLKEAVDSLKNLESDSHHVQQFVKALTEFKDRFGKAGNDLNLRNALVNYLNKTYEGLESFPHSAGIVESAISAVRQALVGLDDKGKDLDARVDHLITSLERQIFDLQSSNAGKLVVADPYRIFNLEQMIENLRQNPGDQTSITEIGRFIEENARKSLVRQIFQIFEDDGSNRVRKSVIKALKEFIKQNQDVKSDVVECVKQYLASPHDEQAKKNLNALIEEGGETYARFVDNLNRLLFEFIHEPENKFSKSQISHMQQVADALNKNESYKSVMERYRSFFMGVKVIEFQRETSGRRGGGPTIMSGLAALDPRLWDPDFEARKAKVIQEFKEALIRGGKYVGEALEAVAKRTMHSPGGYFILREILTTCDFVAEGDQQGAAWHAFKVGALITVLNPGLWEALYARYGLKIFLGAHIGTKIITHPAALAAMAIWDLGNKGEHYKNRLIEYGAANGPVVNLPDGVENAAASVVETAIDICEYYVQSTKENFGAAPPNTNQADTRGWYRSYLIPDDQGFPIFPLILTQFPVEWDAQRMAFYTPYKGVRVKLHYGDCTIGQLEQRYQEQWQKKAHENISKAAGLAEARKHAIITGDYSGLPLMDHGDPNIEQTIMVRRPHHDGLDTTTKAVMAQYGQNIYTLHHDTDPTRYVVFVGTSEAWSKNYSAVQECLNQHGQVRICYQPDVKESGTVYTLDCGMIYTDTFNVPIHDEKPLPIGYDESSRQPVFVRDAKLTNSVPLEEEGYFNVMMVSDKYQTEGPILCADFDAKRNRPIAMKQFEKLVANQGQFVATAKPHDLRFGQPGVGVPLSGPLHSVPIQKQYPGTLFGGVPFSDKTKIVGQGGMD